MIYNLKIDEQKQAFKEKVNYLYAKGAKVDIKEKRKPRTYTQNRYMHLILSWYGIETGYTLSEVKQDIFKRDICEEFFTIAKGDRVVTRSTAELNTLEMTNAIEKFRNHAMRDLNIYLPAPNEVENLNNLEEQIQAYGYAQYL